MRVNRSATIPEIDLPLCADQAFADSQKLTTRPDNATLLKLYAAYKQATEGDNERDKPGFADLVARAKWDAWKKLEGTSSEDAMQQYLDLFATLR